MSAEYEMHVSFTLPLFLVPLALSVLIWIGAGLYGRSVPDPGFGFGQIVTAYVTIAISVFLMLLVWMGFFAFLAFFR